MNPKIRCEISNCNVRQTCARTRVRKSERPHVFGAFEPIGPTRHKKCEHFILKKPKQK